MKRIACLIFAICALIFTSCGADENASNVYTEYNRVGSSVVETRVVHPVSLAEAYNSADLVVMVDINGLDNTYTYPDGMLGVSVFSATINEVYGVCQYEVGDEIYVEQFGTPEATVHGFPLFKTGDKMILCLEKFTDIDSVNETYGERVYSIINGTYGILQVIEIDGEQYVINRGHKDFCCDIYSSVINEVERTDVISELYSYDSVLKTDARTAFEVYKINSVSEYLENLK